MDLNSTTTKQRSWNASAKAVSCQHEQSFYQSDEGTEGFEKISLKQKYEQQLRDCSAF